MSTEIATAIEETTIAATPPLVIDQTDADTKVRKTKKVEADSDDDEEKTPRIKMSPELKKVQSAEDSDFRDVLENIGTDGSFKIAVTRVEPEQTRDSATGRMVKVDGHLKTYTHAIDPEFIAARHGGGKFMLKFLKKSVDGSFKIHTKRVIDVAGDPRTDDVPRNVDPVPSVAHAASGQPGESSPSIVKDVLTVMKDQLDKANDRASHVTSPSGPDPTMMLLIEQLRATNAQQAAEMRELRKEMADARNAKPEKTEGDAFKDGLVKQLLDGDSSRLNAVRLQYESELRQAKADTKSLEDRIRDQFERDKAAIEAAHQREIAFIKHSNEVTLAAVNVSLGTSKDVLNAQIKALERENAQLREDVKELRAKKEKGPLEIAKEMETYKKIFGEGEDKDEKDTAEKVIDVLTNPAAIEFAQGIFGKKGAAAPPQQQQQAQPQGPRIVRAPNGDSFVQRGKDLIPVKKRGQKVAIAAAEGQPPTEVEIPAIDPAKLEMAISYLERAYSGNQEPETVAVSARPIMPEEIMQSIQAVGIDVFFAKVAKLPSASPLASQAGKNWIRKVGKALVGE